MWERVSLLNGIKPDLFVRCAATAAVPSTTQFTLRVCSRTFTKYPRSGANIAECVTEIYGTESTKNTHTHGHTQTLYLFSLRVNVLNVKRMYLAATADLSFDC